MRIGSEVAGPVENVGQERHSGVGIHRAGPHSQQFIIALLVALRHAGAAKGGAGGGPRPVLLPAGRFRAFVDPAAGRQEREYGDDHEQDEDK